MRASKLDLAWGEGGKGERGPTRDEEAQPSRCFPRAGPGGGGRKTGRPVPSSVPGATIRPAASGKPGLTPNRHVLHGEGGAVGPRMEMAWRSLSPQVSQGRGTSSRVLLWPPGQSCGRAFGLLEAPWLLVSEERPNHHVPAC